MVNLVPPQMIVYQGIAQNGIFSLESAFHNGDTSTLHQIFFVQLKMSSSQNR